MSYFLPFIFISFFIISIFIFLFRSKSDKTDVDSTHSSSCLSHHGSVYTGDVIKNNGELPTKKIENLVIPPDALYGQQQQLQQQQQHHQPSSYISYEAVFNDSKVHTSYNTSIYLDTTI